MEHPFLTIDIQLNEKRYHENLGDQLLIDSTSSDHINRALSDGPARLAWYSTLEIEARKIVEDLENEKNETYARLYRQTEKWLLDKYRQEERTGRQATPTVEAVKSYVVMAKSYKDLLAKLSEARRNLGLLSVARTAMAKRHEATLAIASNYRAELSAHTRSDLKGDTDEFRRRREEFFRSRKQ